MRRKIEEEEKISNKSNKEIYSLFNDLQGIAKEFYFIIYCKKK